MVLNGSWVDAHDCQGTPEPCCDLTFDLGSDSDYNLRVRARCGSQTSAWTEASSPFNRRDSESEHSGKGLETAVVPTWPPSFLGSGCHGATADGDVGEGRASGVHQQTPRRCCRHGNQLEARRRAAGESVLPPESFSSSLLPTLPRIPF